MLEKQDLELIAQVVTKALEPVVERLDHLEGRMVALEEHMTALEDRVTALEERMTALEDRVTALEERMTALEARVSELESQMKGVKEDVRGLRTILESDVRCDIRTVAEGHLDLSRKLDEAVITRNEREMIFLRLSTLENDVRILKAQRA